jgi:hypothetical protein
LAATLLRSLWNISHVWACVKAYSFSIFTISGHPAFWLCLLQGHFTISGTKDQLFQSKKLITKFYKFLGKHWG